jgi:hypothetical protein
VRELAGLAREHPFDERVHAQLVLALYRCGRQADALTALHGIRRRLADELGVDLGPALRDLEVAILQQDPALFDIPVRPRPRRRRRPRPSCRTRLGPFVGRERELSALDALLPSLSEAPPGIAVVSGTAGVGKTALVVHWAHRMAGHFPDGQLYVNLRGFDPSGPPVPATACCTGSSTALGVPATRMPTDADGQATATAACSPASGCWWCSTTPATPSRCARCCPARPVPGRHHQPRRAHAVGRDRGRPPGAVAHLSGPESRELLGRRLDPAPAGRRAGRGGRDRPPLRWPAAGAGDRGRQGRRSAPAPAGGRRAGAARGRPARSTRCAAATPRPTSGPCSSGPTGR